MAAKKNLVIVESPAKAKTIGKYLGPDYVVKASMGHLRDLPKSTLGVDVEGDFTPNYRPIKGKEDIIKDLKTTADKSKTVYLATDPDREGEAISWHLQHLLDLPDDKARRVTFNEITKKVVQESIQHPRAIDQDLVDAQQARRVLDLDTPGKGILFTVPLSGVSAQIPPVLIKPEYEKEEPTMEEAKTTPKGHPYHLVLAIVNRGCSEQVMEAARPAGARGGTVILARRVGYEDVQNMLGFTLQPEKEIVAILLPQEQKLPVMQAINREAGLKTDCQGVLFSLPVDDIMGLQELLKK